MCGIIGYLGDLPAHEIVIEGLRRLEYRGYDSWGIAIRADGQLACHKDVGRIADVRSAELATPGRACVGHVRWATHGGVTRGNAHPHLSGDGRIAVVHNGIIENYQALRHELEAKGHRFRSETDTEVIPHLVAEELRSTPDLAEATRRALLQLEGSYAIALLDRDTGTMIGARRYSPLVVGVAEDGWYLASDVPAFLARTNRVAFLDEGRMVVLGGDARGRDELAVTDIASGEGATQPITEVDWTVAEAEKSGHPHFTIKEIREQPLVLDNVIATDEAELTAAADMIRAADRVYVVACGTALHAGMYGTYLLSSHNRIAARAISAGEFPYFADLVTDRDLVLTISQSGETADVMAAVRSARAAGARVLALVNVMGSSLARAADLAILTKAGPEISVVSTKAYLSQLATLVLISAALSGDVEAGKRVLREIRREVEDIVDEPTLEAMKRLAPLIANTRCIYAIGRGVDYPTALEWCLKIKEISYIHAEGFASGDLKHGPLALVDYGVPLFVMATDERTFQETLSNAIEAKARGATLIGVTCQPNDVFDYRFGVRARGPYAAIPGIVYGQILAYYIAVGKGLDPDKPRHLAKSVTVK